MLMPALAAIRLVLSAARPWLCSMRAVASKIAARVSRPFARCGVLRMISRTFLRVRADTLSLVVRVTLCELYSYNKSHAPAPGPRALVLLAHGLRVRSVRAAARSERRRESDPVQQDLRLGPG